MQTTAVLKQVLYKLLRDAQNAYAFFVCIADAVGDCTSDPRQFGSEVTQLVVQNTPYTDMELEFVARKFVLLCEQRDALSFLRKELSSRVGNS